MIKKILVKKWTNKIISNKELCKSIIWKFEKDKVHSPFIDYNCDTDLTDMQFISKVNKGFKFLLHDIEVYSKYSWLVPL